MLTAIVTEAEIGICLQHEHQEPHSENSRPYCGLYACNNKVPTPEPGVKDYRTHGFCSTGCEEIFMAHD